jgi:hypothetical protein
MGRADYLLIGSYNAICDQCGFKFKNISMRTQWDGLRVCKDCFEVRQPQDFVRGVKDEQSVPIARPDSEPTFTEVAQSLVPDEN